MCLIFFVGSSPWSLDPVALCLWQHSSSWWEHAVEETSSLHGNKEAERQEGAGLPISSFKGKVPGTWHLPMGSSSSKFCQLPTVPQDVDKAFNTWAFTVTQDHTVIIGFNQQSI